MNKALFLDRDGIINIDHGYVFKPEQFEFKTQIFELCKRFARQGYLLVVVTNQSGIARGLYTEDDFHLLTQWMTSYFAKQNVTIAKVYYCPHHPTKGHSSYLQACDCRKPQPGMLLQAAQELNIDLSESIIVGDKDSDAQAGVYAGTKRQIILNSTYLENHQQIDGVEYVADLADIKP